MTYIPFAWTVTDMLDAERALQQIARIARFRPDLRADADNALHVQQRELVRCGQQLARFWRPANDARYAPQVA